jgi:hypothetical protein
MVVGRELNTVESVGQQAFIAGQPFETRPRAIGSQVDEVVEIQIDTQPWSRIGAVVEKAGAGPHLYPA